MNEFGPQVQNPFDKYYFVVTLHLVHCETEGPVHIKQERSQSKYIKEISKL